MLFERCCTKIERDLSNSRANTFSLVWPPCISLVLYIRKSCFDDQLFQHLCSNKCLKKDRFSQPCQRVLSSKTSITAAEYSPMDHEMILPTLQPPIIYPFFLMTRARRIIPDFDGLIIPDFDSLCISLLKGVQKPSLSLPKQSKIHLRSSPAGAKFFPMVFIAWFTSQIKKVISKPAHDLDLTLCSLRCCCCTITSSCGSTVCVTEFLALKHKSRILGHSSNPVCTVHTAYSVRGGTTKKLTL